MSWWLEYAQAHEPLIYIGGKADPYMIRWAIVPRNDECNLYLHHFIRDDEDRALHDHPWASTSVCLHGRLREIDAEHPEGRIILPGDIRHRAADYAHRLVVEEPGWTLFVTGKRVRDWGFHCPEGWRHWTRFTGGENGELIGQGCAEYGDPTVERTPA